METVAAQPPPVQEAVVLVEEALSALMRAAIVLEAVMAVVAQVT